MINRDELPYRQGVIAYIRNKKGEYLVFQHPDWEKDKWRMPGGGIMPGESVEQAIKRELKEEFGLDISSISKSSKLVHQFEWPDDLVTMNLDRGNRFRGQQQTQVLIEIDDDQTIKIDPREVSGYRFVYPNEMEMYLKFPGQYEMAIKVINEFENGN